MIPRIIISNRGLEPLTHGCAAPSPHGRGGQFLNRRAVYRRRDSPRGRTATRRWAVAAAEFMCGPKFVGGYFQRQAAHSVLALYLGLFALRFLGRIIHLARLDNRQSVMSETICLGLPFAGCLARILFGRPIKAWPWGFGVRVRTIAIGTENLGLAPSPFPRNHRHFPAQIIMNAPAGIRVMP